jgi:hypothetical protein
MNLILSRQMSFVHVDYLYFVIITKPIKVIVISVKSLSQKIPVPSL